MKVRGNIETQRQVKEKEQAQGSKVTYTETENRPTKVSYLEAIPGKFIFLCWNIVIIASE